MNWRVWADLESILDAHDIRPIVAVVPDNRDPHLQHGPARTDFWEIVRRWQKKSWSIGWHGYQHFYESSASGIVGTHVGSEFAGLSEERQRAKLASAAQIFREQGVTPDVWVAPGHAFDWVTVKLLAQYGISTISDGFFFRAVRRAGVTWIPQQLWRFREMRGGLWTVCFHHNSWSATDVARFAADVARFRTRISSLPDVLVRPAPEFSWVDGAFDRLYRRLVLWRASRVGTPE